LPFCPASKNNSLKSASKIFVISETAGTPFNGQWQTAELLKKFDRNLKDIRTLFLLKMIQLTFQDEQYKLDIAKSKIQKPK